MVRHFRGLDAFFTKSASPCDRRNRLLLAEIMVAMCLLLCLFTLQSHAVAIGYTADEPADDIARALVQKFIDSSFQSINDVKQKKFNGFYVVVVRGRGLCENDNCLTVVFNEEDPGKIALLLSNGKFMVMDTWRLGGHIIFSPSTPSAISVIVTKAAIVVAPVR
jgi:hypothetical protein